ncbi:hypothetical protein HOY80DRAFT_988609 [Tuber brumale]|nr:hypothetical protein HOY80DRAFT_988609 [Tuber brumale]
MGLAISERSHRRLTSYIITLALGVAPLALSYNCFDTTTTTRERKDGNCLSLSHCRHCRVCPTWGSLLSCPLPPVFMVLVSLVSLLARQIIIRKDYRNDTYSVVRYNSTLFFLLLPFLLGLLEEVVGGGGRY